MLTIFFNSQNISTHIIIIIRHELRLNRPVSASSNSFYKGLPNHLRPFGLKSSIMFGILLLLLLVACRTYFDLYLLCFSSPGSTFSSSKFPHSFEVKEGVPGSIGLNRLLSFFLRV